MTTPPAAPDATATPDGASSGAAGRGGPLPASERLLVLDVARGVALLGIFIMNVPGFSRSLFAGASGAEPTPGGLDRIVAALRELLIAGKFNSLFGLLFGIGFALQFARLTATRPDDATRVYARRLGVLGAIGAVHATLLWSGDVLLVYAVLGCLLLLLRRAPDGVLAALVVAGVLLPALFDAARPWLVGPRGEAIAMLDYQELEASNNLAYGEGSFLDAVHETTRLFGWAVGTTLGRWSYGLFYAHMGAALFLGYLVGRRGWVRQLPALRSRVRALQGFALAIAIVGTLVAWACGAAARLGEASPPLAFAGTAAHDIGRLALMVFYTCIVVRVVEARGAASPFVRAFAATGRMPLSNYLLQTLMCLFVFQAWGLGLWNRVGPTFEVLLAIGLYAGLQVPLSIWWLRHHGTGPLEALWRRIAYAGASSNSRASSA
jgi:uncharacterized protein